MPRNTPSLSFKFVMGKTFSSFMHILIIDSYLQHDLIGNLIKAEIQFIYFRKSMIQVVLKPVKMG